MEILFRSSFLIYKFPIQGNPSKSFTRHAAALDTKIENHMSHRLVENGRSDPRSFERMSGYSIVEILVVLTIIAVMTAIALPYFFNYGRMFKSEDQAIKVMDLMREAGQRAMNQRRTVRIELDGNPAGPVLRMIDENPDTVFKTIPLESLSSVRMDTPGGIARPNPPNYPDVAYTAGVWAARFRSNGSVVNAADLPISATLFSWPPSETNIAVPRRNEEIRAITIFGGSGAVRYWKYNGTTFVPER